MSHDWLTNIKIFGTLKNSPFDSQSHDSVSNCVVFCWKVPAIGRSLHEVHQDRLLFYRDNDAIDRPSSKVFIVDDRTPSPRKICPRAGYAVRACITENCASRLYFCGFARLRTEDVACGGNIIRFWRASERYVRANIILSLRMRYRVRQHFQSFLSLFPAI